MYCHTRTNTPDFPRKVKQSRIDLIFYKLDLCYFLFLFFPTLNYYFNSIGGPNTHLLQINCSEQKPNPLIRVFDFN